MMTILLILSLLLAVPVSAAPQYKQSAGNPSLNVNAAQTTKLKKQQTFQPQQIQQQKKQSVATTRHRKQPVQYLENERSNQLTVPMQSTSALRDGHSATPSMTPTTASFDPQAVGSSAAAPLYQTSEQGRKGATANWGGMSGGVAAEGLMASGSRYIDNGQGSAPTLTTGNPTGPRQTNGYPDIPFPDEPVPVGDALIPLALLTLAYVAFMLRKKKKEA